MHLILKRMIHRSIIFNVQVFYYILHFCLFTTEACKAISRNTLAVEIPPLFIFNPLLSLVADC